MLKLSSLNDIFYMWCNFIFYNILKTNRFDCEFRFADSSKRRNYPHHKKYKG